MKTYVDCSAGAREETLKKLDFGVRIVDDVGNVEGRSCLCRRQFDQMIEMEDQMIDSVIVHQ